MTPLGFVPLADAIARCSETWNVSAAETWAKLRPWLHSGRVDSCAVGDSGQTFSVGDEWAAERNDAAFETGLIYFRPLYDERLTGKHAFVGADDLDALLTGRLQISGEREGLAKAETEKADASSTKNKGGAPTKYHLDRFLIEAFRIVYESSPAPRRPAELRQRALQAYSDKYGLRPSEDWARDPIDLLWKELELGA